MRKEHVKVAGDEVLFDYTAKGGKRRVQVIADPDVKDVLRRLKGRRNGGSELLAYSTSEGWKDVRSLEINDYIKGAARGPFSAKDFRTWHGTVLAAVALATVDDGGSSLTARKRGVARAIREVAEYLGNTPAVARASYVDPRVLDRFLEGETIRPALRGVSPEELPTRPCSSRWSEPFWISSRARHIPASDKRREPSRIAASLQCRSDPCLGASCTGNGRHDQGGTDDVLGRPPHTLARGAGAGRFRAGGVRRNQVWGDRDHRARDPGLPGMGHHPQSRLSRRYTCSESLH